jgi:acyl carrier protein phosphodiesterase
MNKLDFVHRIGRIPNSKFRIPNSEFRIWNLEFCIQHSITPMNWLAHTLLSEPDVEFRIGNIAADWVKGAARLAYSAGIQRGFARHRAIDLYTDAHPLVLHSQTRILAPYRRYAGVLVDVFYDHYLIRNWAQFCDRPLRVFIDETYAQFAAHAQHLPAELNRGFDYMRRDDWLGCNATADGVAKTLARIAQRLRPGNLLAEGICTLAPNDAGFDADFIAFFPQLQQHAYAAPHE